MAGLTEAQKVTHLIRRATFGEPYPVLAGHIRQGLEATLQQLLQYESIPDPLSSRLQSVEPDLLDLQVLHDAQEWWVYRMRQSPRPLEEKMTLFWHGHFATANYKVNDPQLMIRQNQLFRKHATGNFLSMLLDVYKDPAMLIWLDGDKNRKGAPNENFARECMELFTIGIGHYTQLDVEAAARALTGWTLKARTTPVFNPHLHDDGVKTILGQTGRFNGDDFMRILAGRRETGQFIGQKLFAFFAYDNPEPAVVNELADVYLKSHYDIKSVLQAIFTHPAFYSAQSVYGHFKNPVEYTVGMLRELDAQYPLATVPQYLTQMGQELFNPPNVGGWPGGPFWINAATAHVRSQFAQSVIRPLKGLSSPVNIPNLVASLPVRSGAELAATLSSHLLSPQIRANTQKTLASRARSIKLTGPPGTWEANVRSLLHLALVAPEYHLG